MPKLFEQQSESMHKALLNRVSQIPNIYIEEENILELCTIED